MPTLVIRFPDGTQQEQELKGALTMGRSEGNDVVLSEGGVSRKHARFFVQGGVVMVEDAGSANGTFVDGERIDAPTPLQDRTLVSIGDYEVSLMAARRGAAAPSVRAPATKPKVKPTGPSPYESDESTRHQPLKPIPRATKMVPVVANPKAGAALARKTKPPSSAVPDGPVLRGLTGPWLNKIFPVSGVVTVGRSGGVEVQLDDDSVSRRHAELEVRPNGAVVLRDLGSANGTLLNGEPVAEEMELVPGDIVQFGVLELAFENRTGALAPKRRAALADTSVNPDDASASRRRLIRVGAGVGAVLLVAVVAKLILGDGPATVAADDAGPKVMTVADEKAALERALEECRQYLNASGGELDLEKADKACLRALQLDPIHPEANELKNKLLREKGCAEAWNKAQKALQLQREEEALKHAADIEPKCSVYLKVKASVLQATNEVKDRAGADCKRYNRNGNDAQALPRCELYMKYACQSMSDEELYPPITEEVSRKGKKWKPKDPVHAIFLKLRARLEPSSSPWRCTQIAILQPPPKERDLTGDVRAHFAKMIPDSDIVEALVLYWAGKGVPASTGLRKVREKASKAPVHALAGALRNSIDNVLTLLKQGQSAIAANNHLDALPPFKEALSLDEALMLGDQAEKMTPLEKQQFFNKYASHYQKAIQGELGEGFAARAHDLNGRGDFRAACKLWKVGWDYYRISDNVIKGVEYCTRRAAKILAEATSCEELQVAFEIATDGDNIKEKVAQKKAELKCE